MSDNGGQLFVTRGGEMVNVPKYVARDAYPALPGTGPEGKRCRHCANCVSVNGGSRSYPKCLANKGRWTHGRATDINTRMPACRLFEAKP